MRGSEDGATADEKSALTAQVPRPVLAVIGRVCSVVATAKRWRPCGRAEGCDRRRRHRQDVDGRRYASVLAVHDDRVALVREEYPTWGGSFWNIPSGAVEREESPEEGAARELREETGLCVRSEQLPLVSTSTSRFSRGESRAWNFSATVEEPTLRIDDPDGLIQDVHAAH